MIIDYTLLHPESQSTKKNSANLWWNYDEIYDETYDVIAVKLFQNV